MYHNDMPKISVTYVDTEKYDKTATEIYNDNLKFDSEKPRMDLLDPLALEGLSDVLTYGAKKYSPHGWREGIQYSRLIAALLRHLFAIIRGQYTDPESNLPHIDHVGANWMFLSNLMKSRHDLNDLYKKKQNVLG